MFSSRTPTCSAWGGPYSNDQSRLSRDKEVHMITALLAAAVGKNRQKD